MVAGMPRRLATSRLTRHRCLTLAARGSGEEVVATPGSRPIAAAVHIT
jgi:hypothetical protein